MDVTNTNGGYLLANAGDYIQFNFSVTGGSSVLSSWHIMANGTNTPTGASGGNVFALTDDGSPTISTSSVPEPGTLSLFGTGLFAAAGLLRRRTRKS
jgi:hypothetical protein